TNAGDKEINVSVVVVVSGRRTHGIPDTLDTGGGRHVGEAKPAVVSKQPVRIRWRVLDQRGRRCAVREENIGTPVVVVVEHREAARSAFNIVLVRSRRVPIHERESRAFGDVAKLDRFTGGWWPALHSANNLPTGKCCRNSEDQHTAAECKAIRLVPRHKHRTPSYYSQACLLYS